jgi:translation initiation factor IF-3
MDFGKFKYENQREAARKGALIIEIKGNQGPDRYP